MNGVGPSTRVTINIQGGSYERNEMLIEPLPFGSIYPGV